MMRHDDAQPNAAAVQLAVEHGVSYGTALRALVRHGAAAHLYLERIQRSAPVVVVTVEVRYGDEEDLG